MSVPVVVGVSVVVFSIVHLLPGDPVLAILSGANAMAMVRAETTLPNGTNQRIGC